MSAAMDSGNEWGLRRAQTLFTGTGR